MKLESISIRDFRCIDSLDLSFKDELDLIRDRIPIVGPNTSGKTTILDAIALSLMPMADVFQVREGLRLSSSALVRSGATKARVSSTVWFSDDEIEATKEVIARSGGKGHPPVSSEGHFTVHWTYPHPENTAPWGDYLWEPANGLTMSKGREYLEASLHVPGLGPRLFQRLGGVFMFDQQRTGLSNLLSLQERRQLGQLLALEPRGGDNGDTSIDLGVSRQSEPVPYSRTKDPRLILTYLAKRAQDPEATEKEDFARLKQLYERVCYPHKMGEYCDTEHGPDVEFRSDQGRYYYDGLSSGQQMILLLLLQFVHRRIHHSIVLIDELELHLHPLWQDRLYTALTSLGEDNQYIFTTHSTHLRDTIRDQSYYATGEIAGHAVTS